MRYETLYDILGVAQNATMDEIKNAYRRQAMKWHPDRNPGNRQKSEEMFKRIGYAFKILSNPGTRAQYDFELSEQKNSYQQRAQTPPPQQETPGVSEEEAEKMFFEQLLDLAFELAARGYNEATIAKTLVGLDCPSGMARAAAASAVKVASKNHGSGNNSTSKQDQPSAFKESTSPQGDEYTKSKSDHGIDIDTASWEEAKPYYDAVISGTNFDRKMDIADATTHEITGARKSYLKYFEQAHNEQKYLSFSWAAFCFRSLWSSYRKMQVLAYSILVLATVLQIVIYFTSKNINQAEIYSWGLVFVECLLFGFFGKYLYFRRAKARIREVMDLPFERAVVLLKQGGGKSTKSAVIFSIFPIFCFLLFSMGAITPSLVGGKNQKTQQQQTQQQEQQQQQQQAQAATTVQKTESDKLLDLAIAEVEAKHPELNPNSPHYRPDLVDVALKKAEWYVKQGIAPHTALRMAIAEMEQPQPTAPSRTHQP